uniref:ABC transporter B family member 9 n=1 Tax=Kalanchoe fedtschenkoi TaxID=63787 RepID=A0A7N0REW6_KALFE
MSTNDDAAAGAGKRIDNGGSGGGVEKQYVSFYKLFSFADRLDVALMVVGTAGAVVNGVSQPFMTIVFGQLINSFAAVDKDSVLDLVSEVSLKFVYLAIVAGTASFLQVACWMATGERQAARIRSLYLKTMLRQDVGYFDTEVTTGEVIGRMSGDTNVIQEAIGEKVGKFIQLASTFVGGFIIAFIKGWKLALVLLPSIPVMVVAGAAMALVMSRMSSRVQSAYADAGNVVDQTVGAIRTVVSFTGEKKAIEKYDQKLVIAYESIAHQGMASGAGLGCIMVMSFFTYALALWYGGRLILKEGYNGGQVMNVLFALMTGGMSLGQAAPSVSAFGAGKAAAYKMFETIKRNPTIDPLDPQGTVLEDIKGDIELKDVYFRYPARPDVQIFSGFSLTVASGTTAALVGQSGSGKSTVVSLVERFYDPDSGEVLIDGINLKQYQLKWIRQKIGLVSQEPVLFGTTIRENIAYGKDGATTEEIRTAITLANAAKFIDKLPQGLDTMVGEHGTQLSGGQKQRIAIARAIMKNPRILLLDEATSALDAESERIVQDALVNIMSNRTTVVVAHRLTTIQNAGLIAVVHQGKIVEQGTHAELIKDPEGAYSQLVQLQQGGADTTQHENEEKSLDKANSIEFDRNVSRSRSQRSSVARLVSRNSSSSRPSFSLIYTLPGPSDFHGTELGSDHSLSQYEEDAKDGLLHKSKKDVPIWKLAQLNKPELPVIVLGSIGAVVNGLVFPVFGLLISNVIKIFYQPPSLLRKDSKFWAVIFVVIGLISFVAAPLQNYFFGVAGGKLIQRIRSLCFKKIVHQEISWFDEPANSSGAVGARLSTDAAAIKSIVGDALALIVQNITTIIAGLVIAFTANWILALVILGASPIMILQGFLQTKFTKGFSKEAKVMYEEASQVASDAVGSIRTVASFCAEEKVMDLYMQKCKGPVDKGVRLGFASGFGFGFSNFALFCTNALCFYIGAVLINHGLATFPQIFKVFFALTISAIGVSSSLAMAPDRKKAKDSTASVFRILESKPKIDSSSDEGSTLSSVTGNIGFEHVSFKYPGRQDIQIFKDLCLKIPAGKTVALVGESGSGKSTVISLIQRFYNPDSGRVALDGVEIQTLKLSWLRQQTGLVSQEPVLFNETIRDNIAYGKQGASTEEEIIEAAKASNAHKFISSLPQGYNTNVGERGVQLSGGQKQRIAIARAIIKDPKILLLDEATSALDAESERIVQEALDRVMVNRTTVVVAHRLSTIRGADIIAVVKNGIISEEGSHDSLIKIPDGAYASLVALHTRASPVAS